MASVARLVLLTALSLSSITQAYVLKVRDHEGQVKNYDVPSSNLTAEEFLANPQPVHFRRKIGERETPCVANPQIDYYYKIIGNGNPHQNYKIGQVAKTLISCPGTVGIGESHTFSWSIGGNTNPGNGKYDFASLGFTVGESDTKQVSESFDCAGGMTEICAMHYTAVTAITVEFWSTTTSCGQKTDNNLGTGVVYLPNANSVGSTISRGTNFGDRNIIQCRGESEREIDFFCGPPGGPEWFDTNEIGPWSDAYQAQKVPADCEVPIEALKFLS